jgi:ribulose-phosphate 3-epimerase
MNAPVIAASILAADFARLGEEAERVLQAGADWIHFDVMDQHYVPNLTVGPMVCASLRRHGISAPIDVHLMVEPVDALALAFADAGASLISFHPEASRHPHRTVEAIRRAGCAVGLALNPATPLHWLDHLLGELDLVLLMSVDPGFGGQSFLPSTLAKIRSARARIEALGRPVRLEVDGGLKADNVGKVAAAGADTFVAGTAIFAAPDYAQAIAALRAAIAAGA